MERDKVIERLEDIYEKLSGVWYSELDVEESHLIALEHAVMLLEEE